MSRQVLLDADVRVLLPSIAAQPRPCTFAPQHWGARVLLILQLYFVPGRMPRNGSISGRSGSSRAASIFSFLSNSLSLSLLPLRMFD